MKIVITGGHFTPAFSVIQKLDDQILVVGRRFAFEGDISETFEYKVCKEKNIPFVELKTGRLQRRFTKNTIPSLFKFPQGVYQSLKILNTFKPDVVVTFGGYIGLPVAIAASLKKIPVVLHEQTQKAGLASRLISKFANTVCISFESSKPYFKNKNVVLTGNPIREEFFEKKSGSFYANKKPFIYITGGSTGSHAINMLIGEIIKELLPHNTVIHQTGNNQELRDFEKIMELKQNLPHEIEEKYIVKQFFSVDEVAYFFQNAELIIARSGINTVLELLASHASALLIPLPTGQNNEQLDNAKLFKSTGNGEYFEQADLTAQKLYENIRAMIINKEKYVSTDGDKYVIKNAVDRIISQIYKNGREQRGESNSQKKKNIAF